MNNLFRILVLSSILFFSGCKTLEKIAVRSTQKILQSGYLSFLSEEDPVLAKDAAASNLKMIDALLLEDRDNTKLQLLSGKAFFSYAFAFIEENDKKRASKLYLRGLKNSVGFLDYKNLFFNMSLAEYKENLKKLLPEYFENLFFAGLNFASWINLNKSDLVALNNQKKIEYLAEEIIKIDPSYYYGGPHLLLALYHASQPKILGGNDIISRKHFEKCLEINQKKFLPSLFFYAKIYSLNVQDRELFIEIIKIINDFDLDKLPEQRLPNTIIKERGKKLFSQIDDLFI